MKKFILLLLVLPGLAFGNEPAAGDVPAGDPDDFLLFDEAEVVEVYDPLEPFNRLMFGFNDIVYFYLAKPVARGWRFVAPEPLRVSVRNVFDNLKAPVRMVNAGLQGKFSTAGTEFKRFMTNSTLGIGGMFDPAKEHFNLQPTIEDTGQTLGFYGMGPGPYLVLPLLGPSSIRDSIGAVADTNLDLTWYIWGYEKSAHNYDYVGARAFEAINFLSIDKDTYEGIKRDALDPYLFTRDAYLQFRSNLVRE